MQSHRPTLWPLWAHGMSRSRAIQRSLCSSGPRDSTLHKVSRRPQRILQPMAHPGKPSSRLSFFPPPPNLKESGLHLPPTLQPDQEAPTQQPPRAAGITQLTRPRGPSSASPPTPKHLTLRTTGFPLPTHLLCSHLCLHLWSHTLTASRPGVPKIW